MRVFQSMLLLATLLTLSATAHATLDDVHITEAYYCHPSGDDGYEWVELTNYSEFNVVLDGAILATGGFDYTWSTVTLSGTILGCGTYVIGGPFSDPTNGDPTYSMVFNFEPDIQNGGVHADGIALFAPGADVTVDTPIDALIYGDINYYDLRDESGGIGDVEVTSVTTNGVSLERTAFLHEWRHLVTPDPGHVELSGEGPGGACQVVRAAPSSWGTVKGNF